MNAAKLSVYIDEAVDKARANLETGSGSEVEMAQLDKELKNADTKMQWIAAVLPPSTTRFAPVVRARKFRDCVKAKDVSSLCKSCAADGLLFPYSSYLEKCAEKSKLAAADPAVAAAAAAAAAAAGGSTPVTTTATTTAPLVPAKVTPGAAAATTTTTTTTIAATTTTTTSLSSSRPKLPPLPKEPVMLSSGKQCSARFNGLVGGFGNSDKKYTMHSCTTAKGDRFCMFSNLCWANGRFTYYRKIENGAREREAGEGERLKDRCSSFVLSCFSGSPLILFCPPPPPKVIQSTTSHGETRASSMKCTGRSTWLPSPSLRTSMT
jgi:hypothetical protein